jgi:NAD(P)-dependent dehydrogenase (short-subunit alcohol dehydrogenase family)
MKIDGAVVLVTGANRGLGRALVRASLDRGARRVYAAARDPKQLERQDLDAQTRDRIVPLALDITSAASLEAAAAQAKDVTLLVNNAGVLAAYGVLASTPEDLAADFATNFFGTLASSRAFLPALERSGGAIVNVLSVSSLANLPALGGYSAAKAASFSATQALRADLVKRGVSVHAVLPGPIDTDMVKAMEMPKTSPEDVARAILDGVEEGLEEILPDPASRQMFDVWKSDPKALARQLASMM